MNITSLDNQQIKLLQKLKQKKYRQQIHKFVVEGVHLVALALENARAEHVFLTKAYRISENGKLYKADVFIATLTCPYVYISTKIADKLAGTITTQGIFALCKMEQANFDGSSIILFDGLQDPGNVGTIIRTAQAFHVHNFYFTATTVDPYNDKTVRASQGALFFSNFFLAAEQPTFLAALRALPHVYALDTAGQSFEQLPRSHSPFGLIVGNEAKGITHESWGALAIEQITIPMSEQIESLNVAIAAGIALYELQQ